MKKVWGIVLCGLILAGCAGRETFETLGNVEHERSEATAMGTVQLHLPEEAAAAVLANGGNTCYECQDYSLMLQTVAAGDFAGTVMALSGFSPEKLTIIETNTGTFSRYDWVWTAAGEGGDVLCRAGVLDDGNYHYCLCAMVSAEKAADVQQEWAQVFASFSLS